MIHILQTFGGSIAANVSNAFAFTSRTKLFCHCIHYQNDHTQTHQHPNTIPPIKHSHMQVLLLIINYINYSSDVLNACFRHFYATVFVSLSIFACIKCIHLVWAVAPVCGRLWLFKCKAISLSNIFVVIASCLLFLIPQ